MAEPILFVVDADPAVLASLAAVLERRFGADYRILTDPSPASALARIEQACGRGEKVALLVADLWTSETGGPEWFVRVRELCPGAGRCVLVRFGDAPAYYDLRRVLALGQAETYFFKPWGHPEERLYPVVSEMLAAWARTALPQPAILRIVGERWSPRFVELRDLAARNWRRGRRTKRFRSAPSSSSAARPPVSYSTATNGASPSLEAPRSAPGPSSSEPASPTTAWRSTASMSCWGKACSTAPPRWRRRRSRGRTSSSSEAATPPARRPCIWRGTRRR